MIEKSLTLFAEKLKESGISPDDKFIFSCYADGMITYSNAIKENLTELTFITDKECLPVMSIRDLFLNAIKHIEYVSCSFYKNGDKLSEFCFNVKSTPMFYEEKN